MSHAEPEQLAGLALDPTDGPADVREHAETCPECAGLVAAFTGVRRRAGEEGEPGVHEVWLINVDGKRMISIGLLASGDEGEFAVPMDLIGEGYRIVDISVEPDDGDPTHSGVSIARGELA